MQSGDQFVKHSVEASNECWTIDRKQSQQHVRMGTDHIGKGLPLVNVVPFTAYVHPEGLCSEAELLQFQSQPREQCLNVVPEGNPFLVGNIVRMRKYWLHRCDDALDVVDHAHRG